MAVAETVSPASQHFPVSPVLPYGFRPYFWEHVSTGDATGGSTTFNFTYPAVRNRYWWVTGYRVRIETNSGPIVTIGVPASGEFENSPLQTNFDVRTCLSHSSLGVGVMPDREMNPIYLGRVLTDDSVVAVEVALNTDTVVTACRLSGVWHDRKDVYLAQSIMASVRAI